MDNQVNIRKRFQHSVRTIKAFNLTFRLCVNFCCLVKADRRKELHGCERIVRIHEVSRQLSDHILPQINDSQNQLSTLIIVFQVVGWVVVVVALITSININKSPVDETIVNPDILGYDQNGTPCYTCFTSYQGFTECCD